MAHRSSKQHVVFCLLGCGMLYGRYSALMALGHPPGMVGGGVASLFVADLAFVALALIAALIGLTMCVVGRGFRGARFTGVSRVLTLLCTVGLFALGLLGSAAAARESADWRLANMLPPRVPVTTEETARAIPIMVDELQFDGGNLPPASSHEGHLLALLADEEDLSELDGRLIRYGSESHFVRLWFRHTRPAIPHWLVISDGEVRPRTFANLTEVLDRELRASAHSASSEDVLAELIRLDEGGKVISGVSDIPGYAPGSLPAERELRAPHDFASWDGHRFVRYTYRTHGGRVNRYEVTLALRPGGGVERIVDADCTRLGSRIGAAWFPR